MMGPPLIAPINRERASHDNMAAMRNIFEAFVTNCQKHYQIGEHCTIDEMRESFRGRSLRGHDETIESSNAGVFRRLIDVVSELDTVMKEHVTSSTVVKAVDEQIIPTKCRHELKQFNPAKSHKWGYKNQVWNGGFGFNYDFNLFAGDQSNTCPSDAPDLGVSSNVVSRLTSSVLRTVNLNRVPNADIPTEKDLKKIGCGAMVEKVATIDNVKLGNPLVIVHAGGEAGFVPNALLTFKADTKSGDYHDNMNSDNYERWLRTKLIPNLPPNSVVVVDNASYHNKQLDAAPTSTTKKADMQTWLQQKEIQFEESMLKPELYNLIKKI
ncbi:hypothetical protein EVAR_6129_1 [Eumeta japonica]|uniref:PiggyBac transposable element-derived protein domain-containing protein n=1 Tax=Eumeta variegata TaxID=151549 RepID=A0A4C1TF28_EUMVA|nr:hypothetical protein EVAR_6129_1 [Eumeta japonica]